MTHAQTGLTVSCIGTVIAIVTLIAAGKEGPGLLKKIDYKTLLFFIGLFVVVGGAGADRRTDCHGKLYRKCQ